MASTLDHALRSLPIRPLDVLPAGPGGGTVVVQFRAPSVVHAAMAQEAGELGMTVSELVRQFLREGLARRHAEKLAAAEAEVKGGAGR